MQAPFSDQGRFETKNASRYLQQLCKHFAHKIEVQFDQTAGTANFPFGVAIMAATEDALIVDLTADTVEGLKRGRIAIDSHLETFAFREAFKSMDWAALRIDAV